MDLQSLYDSFVSLVDPISADDLERETQRAIEESSDSYLLGDMDFFEDEFESQEVHDVFSSIVSSPEFMSEIRTCESGWSIFDMDGEEQAA